MANVNGGTYDIWDNGTPSRTGHAMVNLIVVTTGATGGATTLTSDGETFYVSIGAANTVETLSFACPQKVQDLAASGFGTNATVYIYYA